MQLHSNNSNFAIFVRSCSIQTQSLKVQPPNGISSLPIYRILMDCSHLRSIAPTNANSRSFLRLCSKNEEIRFPFDSDEAVICNVEESTELERRRKIGLANKGKVPWNKGRPHSPETRERIKQRTIEALRDPKIRNKMSVSPRKHSDQVKTKISFSLKQLWRKRLKCRRAKEKLYLSWSESIAEFARKGGVGEEELSWDSYETLRREISLRNLEHAIEKATAEENRKILQRERKEEMKAKKSLPKKRRKAKEVDKELNLKARLIKIQRKKTMNGQKMSSLIPTITSCYPSFERLDLQLIEREKMRMQVSLADEIQAAKNRRV